MYVTLSPLLIFNVYSNNLWYIVYIRVVFVENLNLMIDNLRKRTRTKARHRCLNINNEHHDLS